MKKQVIRLTEGDLRKIIENSVKRIIREEKTEKEKENDESWKEFDNQKPRSNRGSTQGYDDKEKNPKWTNRELASARYHKNNWIRHREGTEGFEYDHPKKNKNK